MGIFDFLKGPDINSAFREYGTQPQARLLDVRTFAEYREGHLPGSENIPLQQLDRVEELTDSPDTPIYVYCQSGSRSRQAAALLQRMGYTHVTNMGGISGYRGTVER